MTRNSDVIRKEIAATETALGSLKGELKRASDAEHAARAEAGKNDPASGFYTGFARDPWGYPADPLLND